MQFFQRAVVIAVLGSAYPAIAADVIARYGKLREAEVHYVTGMDEHGEKIAQTAVSLVAKWKLFHFTSVATLFEQDGVHTFSGCPCLVHPCAKLILFVQGWPRQDSSRAC